MKVLIEEKPKEFQPINLHITIESEAELAELIERLKLSHIIIYSNLSDPKDIEYCQLIGSITSTPSTRSIAELLEKLR